MVFMLSLPLDKNDPRNRTNKTSFRFVYFRGSFYLAKRALRLVLPKHLHPRAVWVGFLILCCFAALSQPVVAQTRGTKKLPSAEKVVDNYLKAIGGKKQASSIRDAIYDWTIQLKDQPAGVARIQFKTPASQHSDLTIGNGQIISAANPRSAWVKEPGGELRTLTGPDAANAKLQAALDVAHLIDYKKANVLARVVSLDNSALGPAYVVEFSSRGGARLRYFFSTTTRLLLGIQDEARKIITWFEDYRPEGNILEPHILVRSVVADPSSFTPA